MELHCLQHGSLELWWVFPCHDSIVTKKLCDEVQYIPRNMHTVFALLCFVVVIHWLIFPYPSGLLHWHCGNLTIAPVPAKQPWWIWINTSCEFIMNNCITTTKQSTTKPCAYFLGYTVTTSYNSGCQCEIGKRNGRLWMKMELSWWRHQMETFSALLALCAGKSPVPSDFPAQRPVTRSFDVFYDLRPNKRLNKQSRGWWFERPSRPLWRHHNVSWLFGDYLIWWISTFSILWLLLSVCIHKHTKNMENMHYILKHNQ